MFHKLESINIELTNKCNLTCKMCYRNCMKYPVGEMSRELFSEIVEKIKNSSYVIDTIYLHWRGEPCIVKYLPEAIKEIKMNLKARIILFTNGTLLNRQLCDEILDANIDVINFSLDANSKSLYEQIRGENSFDIVRENILYCIEKRNKCEYNTDIEIYSVLLEENMKELLSINNEWKEKVDKLNIKYDMRNSSETKGISKSKCFWPYSNIIIG